MTFERTRDMEVVRAIAAHPEAYARASDDFSPPREDWRPIEHAEAWHVIVRDAGELLGLFSFYPQSPEVWEVHTSFLPAAYGEKAKAAARKCVDWIFRSTTCRTIVALVPEYNRLAIAFARAAGMQQLGRLEQTVQKHGCLWDQILLAVSK